MIDTILCLNCKTETPRTRENKKFCSTECRVNYFLNRKRTEKARVILDEIDILLTRLRTEYL